MRRRLEIRREWLSELTVDELTGIVGGASAAGVGTCDLATAVVRAIVGPGDWTTDQCTLTLQNCH